MNHRKEIIEIYKDIYSTFDQIKANPEYQGYCSGEEYNHFLNLIQVKDKLVKPLKEILNEQNRLKFIHKGDISFNAIKKCTFYSDLTFYQVGNVNRDYFYDNGSVHCDISLPRSYLNAMNDLKPLLLNGQALITPETVYGTDEDIKDYCKDYSQNVSLKSMLDNRTITISSQPVNNAFALYESIPENMIAIPIPYFDSLDLNTLSDFKLEFENDYRSFQKYLMSVLKTTRNSIETQNFLDTIQYFANDIIQIKLKGDEKKFPTKSTLKFGLAVFLSTIPFPASLISLVYSLPVVKDLIEEFTKYIQHDKKIDGLKFPLLLSDKIVNQMNEKRKIV